jgi:hypothetical protein
LDVAALVESALRETSEQRFAFPDGAPPAEEADA